MAWLAPLLAALTLDEVTALTTFALVIQVCGDKIIIGGKDCPHVPATELAVGTPEEKWWRDALEGFYKGGGPSVETGVFLTHLIKVLWGRGHGGRADVTINKRLLLLSYCIRAAHSITISATMTHLTVVV